MASDIHSQLASRWATMAVSSAVLAADIAASRAGNSQGTVGDQPAIFVKPPTATLPSQKVSSNRSGSRSPSNPFNVPSLQRIEEETLQATREAEPQRDLDLVDGVEPVSDTKLVLEGLRSKQKAPRVSDLHSYMVDEFAHLRLRMVRVEQIVSAFVDANKLFWTRFEQEVVNIKHDQEQQQKQISSVQHACSCFKEEVTKLKQKHEEEHEQILLNPSQTWEAPCQCMSILSEETRALCMSAMQAMSRVYAIGKDANTVQLHVDNHQPDVSVPKRAKEEPDGMEDGKLRSAVLELQRATQELRRINSATKEQPSPLDQVSDQFRQRAMCHTLPQTNELNMHASSTTTTPIAHTRFDASPDRVSSPRSDRSICASPRLPSFSSVPPSFSGAERAPPSPSQWAFSGRGRLRQAYR